jgi:glutamate synthase domain-containing protein 1
MESRNKNLLRIRASERERSRATQEYFSRYKIPSGCAIFGIMDESGNTFNGSQVIDGIALMHERSNGLGGGFAAYGIYPQYKDDWAFHILYDDTAAKKETEEQLNKKFKVLFSEEIPTRKTRGVEDPPIIYRYFLKSAGDAVSGDSAGNNSDDARFKLLEEDYIVDFVMSVNVRITGAYIISSGKNMGIFKGVGFPEDIGNFFRLEEYRGHIWTSHGRFPTNSIGWWGGAHPFGLLDWSVVHNGEISSYGANKRFISGFGYECTLSTDTEVIAYLFDLIARKQKVDLELIHLILASPLWDEIERMPAGIGDMVKTLRILYGSALINGPFSIIVGSNDFMYALNDRIKLRPMVAARKDDYIYVSSEEAPIKLICPDPDTVWRPSGGEPVIGRLKKSLSLKVK